MIFTMVKIKGLQTMLQRLTKTATTSLVIAIICIAIAPAGAAAISSSGWSNYTNERHGFFIAYPKNIFKPVSGAQNIDGAAFISADGRARLLIGAFANETGMTMKEYRKFVREQSYGDADIDYAPVRSNFFVFSGVRDGVVFYERVSFTCDGDLINSWAMLYPEDEKDFYDRLVEAVAKTYRPGSRSCQ